MRTMDFFAGVPLCFILTIIFKLISIFTVSKDGVKPSKVLLIELSEMGSAILANPAMCKLRSKLDARLHFVIFQKNKPSLDLLKTVKEEDIFTIREDRFLNLFVDTLRFLSWTRRKKIDTVIDLELFSRFTALLTACSGASNRTGFYAFHNEGLYRGDLLNFKVAYNPHIHIAQNFIALVNALTSEKEEVPYSKSVVSDDEIKLPKVTITDSEKKAMFEKIKTYYPAFSSRDSIIVLVNSNASDLLPQRSWPQKNYISIIEKILMFNPRILVLLTGMQDEKQGVQVIADAVHSPRCINFAGAIEFSALTTLYSISLFMLSSDSGPAHFASVTELQTFVIFGPETPALYGSLGKSTSLYAGLACSPCVSAANHRKTPCTKNICLEIISPDQVFDTLNPLLESIHAE